MSITDEYNKPRPASEKNPAATSPVLSYAHPRRRSIWSLLLIAAVICVSCLLIAFLWLNGTEAYVLDGRHFRTWGYLNYLTITDTGGFSHTTKVHPFPFTLTISLTAVILFFATYSIRKIWDYTRS